jgi:hypothetical protein
VIFPQFCLLRPAQASYIIGTQYKGMVAVIDPQRGSGRSIVFTATHRFAEVKDAKAL